MGKKYNPAVGDYAKVTRRDDSHRGRIGLIFEKVHCMRRMKFRDGSKRLFYLDEIENT